MTTHAQDIIHRLLNGQATEADLKILREDAEAAALLDIIQEAGQLDVEQGLSKEEAWQRIASQLRPAAKVRSLNPILWMASAAAAVIVVGLIIWTFSGTPDTTVWMAGAGETTSIDLKDGTHVVLNAGSTLTLAGDSRQVTLDGTALFEVTKGSPFLVNTHQGTVQVLGTRFEVLTDEETYVVRCFEGTVAVNAAALQPDTLRAGEGVRLIEGQWQDLTVAGADPAWTNGNTSFEGAPLREVLNAYERQFGVEVDYSGDNRPYSGAFPHNNADQALELIRIPMGLEVESSDGQVIRLRKVQE